MTLTEMLTRRISADGPMPVSEYMATCLTHPELGYYTSRDPLGAAGDFITAPEISQMFGELVGLALAQAWLDQGAPAPVTLAELGPGRGTLMADALRATRQVPGFHDALSLTLVEASPVLRARQKAALAGWDVTFSAAADALPEAPTFLIANEFFDALPIRQYLRAGAGWRERLVGLQEGALAFGLGSPVTPAALAGRDDVAEGGLVELCPAAESVMAAIAGRIARHGGGALIIDYGDWRSLGDTLQALRGHKPESPLAHPGAADLTAHVDFEALARAAEAAGAVTSRLTPQGVFLERLGIAQRARTLAAGLEGARLDAHLAAHGRLTHPDEMGTLFKVLGLVPEGATMLPGLLP
jgi:SAM-dependent MidA family methyltransferase